MGLSGRVPRRVNAATKGALIGLVDGAVAGGWTIRHACGYLELSQRRLERWRCRGDDLDDAPPGGNPTHGITPQEQNEILAVFNEWANVDRSHRKLAHRGSWLGRFWADPSTVRRVLERHHLRFRAPKRDGRSARRPWPAWVEEKPNRIWIYDTTHWTRAGAATTVISDVISRKWIADITSTDETSTEVQAVFNRVGLGNSVGAGQAAFWYSLMSPAHRVVRSVVTLVGACAGGFSFGVGGRCSRYR